ncbi:MAG: response regulator [Acidimicrobiales bacterium]|jgi:chemotaxis response regulator CheB|nr:response regulator [Acidimicrobiales bacterium]
MPLPPRPLTLLLCEPDPWSERATRQTIEDAGFALVGTARNAAEAIQICEYLTPSAVVLANEQFGMSGLEALPELRRGDGPPEVVLISIDETPVRVAMEQGAFGVTRRGDLEHLAGLLADLRTLLETGERRQTPDRRSGLDRREAQDWSKVLRERRSGEERRQGPRRADELR